MEEQKVIGYAKKIRHKWGKKTIKWYNQNARDFLWRKDRTPYKVLISEIVLKRTTATAASKIYSKFLTKYPDIFHLVKADIKDIENILKEHKIPPDRLVLEITEDSAIRDINYTIGIIRKLEDLGIKIHLDDFGKGNSSLSTLNQLPISTIKIDRSFIRRLEKDGKNVSFVRTIILLANELGIETIAEGIENKEQHNNFQDILQTKP